MGPKIQILFQSTNLSKLVFIHESVGFMLLLEFRRPLKEAFADFCKELRQLGASIAKRICWVRLWLSSLQSFWVAAKEECELDFHQKLFHWSQVWMKPGSIKMKQLKQWTSPSELAPKKVGWDSQCMVLIVYLEIIIVHCVEGETSRIWRRRKSCFTYYLVNER